MPRGRPKKVIKQHKLFDEKISLDDIKRILENEGESIKKFSKENPAILNFIIIFEEKEKNYTAFYRCEIENSNVPVKSFDLKDAFPEKFGIMETSIKEIKEICFPPFIQISDKMFDSDIITENLENIIIRDYTLIGFLKPENIINYI